MPDDPLTADEARRLDERLEEIWYRRQERAPPPADFFDDEMTGGDWLYCGACAVALCGGVAAIIAGWWRPAGAPRYPWLDHGLTLWFIVSLAILPLLHLFGLVRQLLANRWLRPIPVFAGVCLTGIAAGLEISVGLWQIVMGFR